MSEELPSIPPKRYFTIGEVSTLCGVKPHVLRYWEQEFTQLRPVKRRGNRRYYQHHEVLLIRKIRELLYDRGFTINGARNQLGDGLVKAPESLAVAQAASTASNNPSALRAAETVAVPGRKASISTSVIAPSLAPKLKAAELRAELKIIRDTLLF
jgi:DNA-binding transcriptional MerR regulator